MKQPFIEVAGRTVAPRLAHLSGGLEAETTQVGNGLAVTVVLANEGDADLRLHNPFATVQFEVCGSRGQPLAVPRAAPSALIHVLGGAPAWVAADNPIPVIEVRRDGEVTELTALDGATILAPAHQICSATFLISRIAEREVLGYPGDAEFSAPAEGRYTVGSVVTVIDADHLEAGRIVQTAPIEINLIQGLCEPGFWLPEDS